MCPSFVGGLLVAFLALRLDFDTGFRRRFLSPGCSAMPRAPLRFGTQRLSLCHGLHAFIFVHARPPRRAMRNLLVRLVFALLANLGIFLALSLLLVARTPLPVGTAWPRLLLEPAVLSQAFLALIAPWFFALQAPAPWRSPDLNFATPSRAGLT